MDPYVYLLAVAIVLISFGAFVAFMAHRQRLEDEAAEGREGHDVPAE